MKIGGEYKLSQTGLRQWRAFARELRLDSDEVIGILRQMAERIPDEINALSNVAREQGLNHAMVDRLTTRLTDRARECGRIIDAG